MATLAGAVTGRPLGDRRLGSAGGSSIQCRGTLGHQSQLRQSTGKNVSTTEIRLRIPAMDCPACVSTIQRHLSGLDGVLGVEGNPSARTLRVTVDPIRASQQRVLEALARLGYDAHAEGDRPAAGTGTGIWASPQAHIAIASAALFVLGILAGQLGGPVPLVTIGPRTLHLHDALLIASALVGGWNFFPKGIRAARALVLDMNFLMTVAILGALAIGDHVEAAAIAFLFALAELLESYSVARARRSVEALLKLAPDTARVIRNGRETSVAAGELIPGELVLIRPGYRIPTDGTVMEGASAVDQSAITGESMPVEKGPGMPLFAGTINREGFLGARVDRPATDSMLARIVRLVEEAGGRKTKTERFIDRFARWYTPIVTVAAILVIIVPTVILGAPFVPWFVRGLTLLVIACPCALVISTPVAVVSGVTAAARRGVLIKGGTYLEALGEIRVVAVDKTGTLTLGQPEVVDVVPSPGHARADVLQRAAALERHSEHPLARAIVRAVVKDSSSGRWTVTDFQAIPGRGARARLDGDLHVVGKPDLVGDSANVVPASLTSGGRTVVGLASNGVVMGWIAISDRPRPEAAAAVRALRKSGIKRVVMLTGDNFETATAIGHAIGVDEVRADLTPEDKVEAVRSLELAHGGVAMVGDGINDAPALAAATVGIAMGTIGSDAALETADVALMGDDLGRLAYVHRLAQRSRAVIRQNIGIAILMKAVLAVGIPFGLVSLVAAVVLGDMGVSLAVILNALRLGRASGS